MSKSPPPSPPLRAGRRAEAANATRAAILRAARRRFGKVGFADAGLDEIARGARVTTGAIYHHFGGKEGLFEAAAEAIEREILDAVIAAAANQPTPRDQLDAGIAAMFERAGQDDVRRIVFIDAPIVFGPARWREIEMRYAFGLLRDGLARAAHGRPDSDFDPEIAAPALLGALVETARAVAAAADVGAARGRALRTMHLLLDGLLG